MKSFSVRVWMTLVGIILVIGLIGLLAQTPNRVASAISIMFTLPAGKAAWIERLYVLGGLLLPLFYIPQVARLHADQTRLASFSLSKSTCQLLLRIPALVFALVIVENVYMNLVVSADLLGRAVETIVAVRSLYQQGARPAEILRRLNPLTAMQ